MPPLSDLQRAVAGWPGQMCARLREKHEEDERLSLGEAARLLQEEQLQEAEEAERAELQRQMREVEEQQCQLEEQRKAQHAQLVQSEDQECFQAVP